MKKGFLLFLGLVPVIYLGMRLFPPPLRDGISVSQAIFDRKGHLLRLSLSRDEKYRVWLRASDISPALIEATLAEEDRFFYSHLGVNPVSVVRAFFSNLRSEEKIGASTLTMQLARLRYHLNTKTVWGKLQQMWKAVHLEVAYSKREILEGYLNLAPYGLNIEGVGAASLIYFKKRASELSVAEALYLVALPQSPHIRSPRAKGEQVRSYVKPKLAREWIKRHPEDTPRQEDFTQPLAIFLPKHLPFEAPHFTDDLIQTLPNTSVIVSTLDRDLQRRTERVMNLFLESKVAKGVSNAAVLIVDHRTREIRAMIGSANYLSLPLQGQVNGTTALRSYGSTLKPFVYGLAMEQGLIHPLSLVKDTPRRFGNLNPENSDYDFMGPISAVKALNLSRNLPALNLAANIKDPDLYDWLTMANIRLPRPKEFYSVGLTLGGAELSLETLVSLYSILPNRGEYRPLARVAGQNRNPGPTLLSPEASFVVLEMLKENQVPERASFQRFTRESLPLAWKTGTSNGFKDAWTIGVAGHYTIGVWVGDFASRSNPAFTGKGVAAPLFFRLVESLPLNDAQDFSFIPPKDVTRVSVCALSGGLPGPHCKTKRETWFILGRSPFHTCPIHRAVYVHNHTGLRTCEKLSGQSHLETFEFWDTDIQRLFRMAGISRRSPPPLDPRCIGEIQKGEKPEITSPTANLAYAFRSKSEKTNQIPFIANVEGGKQRVHWFLNEKYLGNSPSLEPFFWKSKPGHYIVRAVDDFGNSDSRELEVTVAD